MKLSFMGKSMLHAELKKWCTGIILITGCGFCTNVFAAVNCTAASGTMAPEISTVALAGSFYAGNDLPVGTVIYQTRARTTATPGISCNGAFDVSMNFRINSEPSGAPFTLNESPFSGQIYPTNVSGVGAAIVTANRSITSSRPYTSTLRFTRESAGSQGRSAWVDVALIKTGPVDSGSVVNGSSLQTLIRDAGEEPGHTGLPITTWTLKFSGQITFITQTCQTPDVNVSMGEYEKSQYFRGIGSVTPWIDSSIALVNCPTFTGYHGSRNYQSITGSGTPSGTEKTSNILRVSLQPLSDFINDANGVFKVTANDGGDPATGIGLQLGYSTDINSSPTTPTNIWTNGDSWDITPPSNGTANFRIPLAARYYQTDNDVTPGPADGSIVFNIDYL